MTLTQAEMEAKYDAERAGTLYIKPAGDLVTAALEFIAQVEHDDELAIAEAIDRMMATPEELQITRHTHHDSGERARDPWTTYALGEAEIDIHDAGGGNLCIPGMCHDFTDAAPLLDLAMLLADERVLEALDPSTEDTDGITAILEEIDGGERKAIDRRFDAVVDGVFDLPDALRARAVSLWEGFLDGIKVAVMVDWDRIKEMPIDTAVDTFGVEAISAAMKAHRVEAA
jgi:hypothetical protein